MAFSRRSLFKVGAAGLTVAPLLGANRPRAPVEEEEQAAGAKPESTTIDEGKGFLEYAEANTEAVGLYGALVDRGFEEDVASSSLQLQHALTGDGSWAAATVAMARLVHRRYGTARLTHVVACDHAELRGRAPEAQVWPGPGTSPVLLRQRDGASSDL